MAKTPATVQPKPVGRPPKKSDLRIEFDPALGESPVRIELLSKEVDAKIKDIRDNGYSFTRGGYRHVLLPGAVHQITVRERT